MTERKHVAVPYEREGGIPVGYHIWCSGCGFAHLFVTDSRYYEMSPYTKSIEKKPLWTFNGNLDVPTFSPSLRQYYLKPKTGEAVTTCHFFVKAGKIEYLTDCAHKMKGLTVPLEKIPIEYHIPGDK